MRLSVAALVVWSVALACTPTANPPVGSASAGIAEKPAINEQTRGEIQALLQTQNRAISAKNQTALIATFDQARHTLIRCANESYDIATRQGAPNVPQVGKIESYLDTYVRTYVLDGGFGIRRIYFRKVDGKWVQSEPADNELGGEKTVTVEDVLLDYWAVDQDVIDGLSKGVLAARAIVLDNLLSADRRYPLAIRFYPTRGSLASSQDCLVVGYHEPNKPTDPYIRFLRYWFNADGTLTNATIGFITHEWLHWAQDQLSPGVTARLPWWVAEGWPDYIGKARTNGTLRFVLCQTPTPTLKQLEDGADLNGPPEIGPNYYSFANTMVEYLYTTYGGKDGYRRLLLAFKDDAVPANVFPKVLNVSVTAFYDAWRVWAKAKYC